MVMGTEKHSICCLDGDGISPELIASCVAVLDALSPHFSKHIDLSHHQVGFASLEQHGTTITETVITAAMESDGVILGPVSHADYPPPEQGAEPFGHSS